jgi:hypothetical protein
MRPLLAFLPLALCAAPALAQTSAAPAPARPQAEVQRALNDPAMADRLANMMQALSKAFLNLPVGEVQAAVEGRAPTAAEKKLTVRDLGRRDDPNFERNLERQVARSGPMIRQSMKVLSDSIPAMMKSLEDVQESIERAAANMPDPTYPRR